MPTNNETVLICDRLSQAAQEFKAHAITLANLEREVGDRLMADLRADAYRGISQSASLIPSRSSEPPAPRGSGWVDAAPIKPIDTRITEPR